MKETLARRLSRLGLSGHIKVMEFLAAGHSYESHISAYQMETLMAEYRADVTIEGNVKG